MDLKDYPALKEAGVCSLKRVGEGAFQIELETFHQHTREELDPTVMSLTKQDVVNSATQVKKNIVLASASLDGLKALLADMDALEASAAVPAKGVRR